MKLLPTQETLLAEAIMDGRVLDENLHRMGVDAAWLTRKLRAQGVDNPKEVFLGLCDAQKELTLYKMSESQKPS